MNKKELYINLDDIRINGMVNRGYGLFQDGVIKSPDSIRFENIYSEEVPYPMYAVDLSHYFEEEKIDIHTIDTIDITAGIYDEYEREIPLDDRHQKVSFVSENALDGYSGSDILPEHDYKMLGSDKVTSLHISSYTGYKEDGICLTDHTLDEGVGFNIQLTNGDFSNLRFLKITMIRITFKSDDTEPVSKPEELTKTEEIVNGSWLADLSDPDIKGYINNGIELVADPVTQSESGIVFENSCTELTPFPMFAVDFSAYLEKKGLSPAEIKSFEIVAIPYNEAGNELKLDDEYQKCCFVSREHLNGYSQSDILLKGNYKEIGSKHPSLFDLTVYDASANNDKFHKLEEGVGFNLQLLNGNYKNIRFLSIVRIKFNIM